MRSEGCARDGAVPSLHRLDGQALSRPAAVPAPFARPCSTCPLLPRGRQHDARAAAYVVALDDVAAPTRLAVTVCNPDRRRSAPVAGPAVAD